MTIVIDHDSYGVRSEFGSLEEAQAAIRACGQDFARVTLRERDRVIYNERGIAVGSVHG